MKKLIIMLLCILSLTGCHGSEGNYLLENRVTDLPDENGCQQIVELFYDLDRMYHIGNGIHLNVLENDNMTESDEIVFPLLTDYHVTDLIMLKDGAYSVLDTDPEAMKKLDENLPALLVYGSNDGVLSMKRYTKYLKNVSSAASEHVIQGGNHCQFGSYGFQKGDGKAEITPQEQIEETVRVIREFISENSR